MQYIVIRRNHMTLKKTTTTHLLELVAQLPSHAELPLHRLFVIQGECVHVGVGTAVAATAEGRQA